MKKMIAVVLIFVMVFGVSVLPADNVNPMIIEVSAAKAKLAAPENIKSYITPSTIKLEWKSVKGASGYKIYRYDENSKKYKPAYTTRETSYKITGLKSKKKYNFKVAAFVKKNGKDVSGELSKEINIQTAPKIPKLSEYGFDEIPMYDDDEASAIMQDSFGNNPEMLAGLTPLNRGKSTKEMIEEDSAVFRTYIDDLEKKGYKVEYFNDEVIPTDDGFILTYRYKMTYKGYCVGKLLYSVCIAESDDPDEEIGRYSFGMVMVVPGLQPENF